MNKPAIFTIFLISAIGSVMAEFPGFPTFPTLPNLFAQPTPAPSPDATTQTVNGPIQRLLVCQAIDSTTELQKLASAVATMDQQVQQSSSGKDKSFFDFAKFKEVVTTMMTTLATEGTTTPSYGQDGNNMGYPKYFFANMSGGDNGYNGNLFPMEIDAWYQPGYSQSYPSSQGQYSRPRPRPRYRPRPRVRPSYRKYGSRRPSMQPVQGKPALNKPIFNAKPRFSARSLDAEQDYMDDPYLSILEPLRPAIRHFLQIAREERELLDNDLVDDYVDLEEDEDQGSHMNTRGVNGVRQSQAHPPHVDNKDRYQKPSD